MGIDKKTDLIIRESVISVGLVVTEKLCFVNFTEALLTPLQSLQALQQT